MSLVGLKAFSSISMGLLIYIIVEGYCKKRLLFWGCISKVVSNDQ
jgi:hypothetical protein